MKNQQQTEIAILSEILRHNREESYDDKDDFASRLSLVYLTNLQDDNDLNSFLKTSSKLHTNFFKYNKIKKSNYLETVFNRLSKKKTELLSNIAKPLLSIYDLFSEIKKIKENEISDIDKKLNIKEEIIQNTFRDAFRERFAFPIARRSKDSSLEVADIEHFHLKIHERKHSFVVVVKGYRSLKGSKNKSRKVNWEDVSHQITKAYRTKPDYILIASARDPVDSLISEMNMYAESVGNKNLIIFVPPMDLVKFLIWRKEIMLDSFLTKKQNNQLPKRETDKTPWETWSLFTKSDSYQIPTEVSNGSIERIYLNRKSTSMKISLSAVENDGLFKIELDRYIIDSKTSLQNDKPFSVIIEGKEIEFEELLGPESRILHIPIKKNTEEIEIMGTEIEGISFFGRALDKNIVKISRNKSSKLAQFYPKTLMTKVGEKVRWENSDNRDHSITSGISKRKTDSLFSSLITSYNNFEVTLNIEGIYDYFCSFHPKEKGKIIVKK